MKRNNHIMGAIGRDRPWTLRALLAVSVLATGLAWELTENDFEPSVLIVSACYIAVAMILVWSGNDWLRFAFSCGLAILAGMVAYAAIFVAPQVTTTALYPWRVALILGTAASSLFLLWHPATGRWMLSR